MPHDRCRALAATTKSLASAVAALVLALLPPSLHAGEQIINANQHPVDPSFPGPPFQNLLAATGASSFHVGPDHAIFDLARSWNNSGKPRMISDDWSGYPGPDPRPNDPCLDPEMNWIQQCYIRDLCADVNEDTRGTEHYEHFDKYLEEKLEHGTAVYGWDPPFGNGWPDNSKTFIEWIYNPDTEVGHGCATDLGQNGTLHLSPDGAKFEWRDFSASEPTDDPVTLLGFGPMGAIAANGDLSISPFVEELRRHRVNLVRVWGIDMWVARCALDPAKCSPPYAEGLTPFVGTRAGHNFDLWTLNATYFNRLRKFAQLAADHGVVVQYDLFDKHGLKNASTDAACIGLWDSSPYKATNNIPAQTYISDVLLSCDCDTGELHWEDPLDNCRPPRSFVDSAYPEYALVAADNQRFLEAVAREIGGIGNVIFEIINEQFYGVDWWYGNADYGEPWQLLVASQLPLPDVIARDAFNGRANESLLSGLADTGQTWVAPAAKIEASRESTTDLFVGKATPRGTSDAPTFYGQLPLASGVSTRFTVAADVEWTSDNLHLALKQGNDSLFVWIHPGTTQGTIKLELYKFIGGQYNRLGVKTLTQPSFTGHVRLVYAPLAGTVEVYINSTRDTNLVGSGVTIMPESASFSGYRTGGGILPSTAMKLDNFEATRTATVILVP